MGGMMEKTQMLGCDTILTDVEVASNDGDESISGRWLRCTQEHRQQDASKVKHGEG